MERGLLWLPLLGVFIWLAWAGWNEYQKVQAYEAWAVNFDRSKYDIRAVMGQSGNTITWGRPTRHGPVALTSLSLSEIGSLYLEANDHVLSPEDDLAEGQTVNIVLTLKNGEVYRVPFTDGILAHRWEKALHQALQTLKSATT